MLPSHLFSKLLKKNPARQKILAISEFRRVVRTMIMYFLDHVCDRSVVASGKIKLEYKKENLERKRQVVEYMFEHLRKESQQLKL